MIKTLINEINYKGKITGVEIDADIIDIANTHFQLDQISNLSIVIDDAFEFVLKTKETYDLIIIDIFQDTEMPNFLFEKFFINRVGDLLKNNGFILFNTMLLNEKHNQRNETYLKEFKAQQFTTLTIPRIENHNELILIQKKLYQK